MLVRNRCLIHYGVLGMKWGIRKDPNSVKYKIYGNGRIEIPAGEQLQRLVASEKFAKKKSSGSLNIMSAPLKKYSYMSFTPTDTADYINEMSPDNKAQSLKRDTVLSLETNVLLKSPTLSEAEAINLDVAKKQSKELVAFIKLPSDKKNYDRLSPAAQAWRIMVERESMGDYSEFHKTTEAIDKEIKLYNDHPRDKAYDPVIHPEKYPAFMYAITNREIAASDKYTTPFIDDFLSEVKSKGYNMLRDENDFGRWAAPVIVLDPEKNVKITVSEKISKKTIKEARKYLKQANVDWVALGLTKNEVGEYIKKGGMNVNGK